MVLLTIGDMEQKPPEAWFSIVSDIPSASRIAANVSGSSPSEPWDLLDPGPQLEPHWKVWADVKAGPTEGPATNKAAKSHRLTVADELITETLNIYEMKNEMEKIVFRLPL